MGEAVGWRVGVHDGVGDKVGDGGIRVGVGGRGVGGSGVGVGGSGVGGAGVGVGGKGVGGSGVGVGGSGVAGTGVGGSGVGGNGVGGSGVGGNGVGGGDAGGAGAGEDVPLGGTIATADDGRLAGSSVADAGTVIARPGSRSSASWLRLLTARSKMTIKMTAVIPAPTPSIQPVPRAGLAAPATWLTAAGIPGCGTLGAVITLKTVPPSCT